MWTKILGRFCDAMAGIAGLLLAGLALITMIDVCGRYFFNSPLYGSYEVTQLVLAIMVFLVIPATVIRQENITVELFPSLPGRLGVWQSVLIAVVSAVVLELLAWRLFLIGRNMSRYEELSADLSFPLAYIAYLMFAMTAVSGLIMFAVPWLPAPSEEAADKEATHD